MSGLLVACKNREARRHFLLSMINSLRKSTPFLPILICFTGLRWKRYSSKPCCAAIMLLHKGK